MSMSTRTHANQASARQVGAVKALFPRHRTHGGVGIVKQHVHEGFAERVRVNQQELSANLRTRFDYIVCGAGTAGCVVAARLATDPNTHVLFRAFFLPARDWQIEDTWYVAGLKDTGSHHIALRDTLVPAANFFDLEGGVPCQPGPLYRAVRQVLPLLHGAVSVGMAEGAVDELVGLANTGRQQLRAAVPMRESETFQGELGRVGADLRAARAFLQAQAASHWRHALAGTLRDEALLTQGTQTATWLATTCVRVADACFALGGSSALYETSPLQRRLRDLHAAAQHAFAQQRNNASAGKLLLRGAVVSPDVLSDAAPTARRPLRTGRQEQHERAQ
jgi:alkylation response protein AidB-like acyl-CoA dehydrogenase